MSAARSERGGSWGRSAPGPLSDPLNKLRGSYTGPKPDIDAIRARAGRMERRRHIGLGTGGAVIAIVGLITLYSGVTPPPEKRSDIALEQAPEPTKEIFAAVESPPQPDEQSAESRLAAESVDETRAPDPTPLSNVDNLAAALERDEPSRDEAPPEGELEVTLSVDDNLFRRGASFTMNACNRGTEALEKNFASGQRYDFEVSKEGSIVWQWSTGQVFTQEYGTERWEVDQCKRYTEIWNGDRSEGGPADAGSYTVVGVLKSDPPVRSEVEPFCLDYCN